MSEAAVLRELEERGVELSITPGEALHLIKQNGELQPFCGMADFGAQHPGRFEVGRTPGCANAPGQAEGVKTECLDAHIGGRRSDASLTA